MYTYGVIVCCIQVCMYTHTYVTYRRPTAGVLFRLSFSGSTIITKVSLLLASIHTALSFFLSHSRSLFTSRSKCVFRVNVLVVKCVPLYVFAFYIKYCVPDDFTKLYPGIMYLTLCEATDREESIADTFFVDPLPPVSVLRACTRLGPNLFAIGTFNMPPLCDSPRNIIYILILRSRGDRLASVSRSNAACPFAQSLQQPRYVTTSIGRLCIVTYWIWKVRATNTLKSIQHRISSCIELR